MKELKGALEAILFTSGEQTLHSLAEGLGVMQSEIERTLRELQADYRERGVRLIRKGDSVKLATAASLEETLRAFHRRERRESLTRAGLETLAIIVHKEPVTRSQIEEIRGVGSERIIRALLMRGLIREVGRSEALGRPILYATSLEFLEHFGLETPEEIPALPPEPELFLGEPVERSGSLAPE